VFDAIDRATSDATGSTLTVVPVDALVLAAAGGHRIQRPWATPSIIELRSGDDLLARFGAEGDHTTLDAPSDATFAPDGTVWVVDRGNRRLLHLDANLEFLGGITSLDEFDFRSPIGVESLSNGSLVVTDTRVGVALIEDPSSVSPSVVTLLAAADGSTGAAVIPDRVAISDDDTIIVRNRTNRSAPQIHRFAADGSPVGPPNGIDGHHSSIVALPGGTVIAFDAATRTVIRLDPSGAVTRYTIAEVGDRLSRLREATEIIGPDTSHDRTPRAISLDRTANELLLSVRSLANRNDRSPNER
jgi:DNA-binding beta-propeller fold protein YncE